MYPTDDKFVLLLKMRFILFSKLIIKRLFVLSFLSIMSKDRQPEKTINLTVSLSAMVSKVCSYNFSTKNRGFVGWILIVVIENSGPSNYFYHNSLIKTQLWYYAVKINHLRS